MTVLKEPCFFSHEDVFQKGLDWYKNLFNEAEPYQIKGEASTTYSRWPHTLDAPKLIREHIPDVKFIYVLRHPVDRAYSHYCHHMRNGITMTFEQALSQDSIYVNCSLYMQQINRYLRFFKPDDFLFLFQHDLKTRPEYQLRRIQNYLGIEYYDCVSDGIIETNVSSADNYIRSKTTLKWRQNKLVNYLSKKLPKAYREWLFSKFIGKSFIGRKLNDEFQIPPMKAVTRTKLIRSFEKPNQALEKFLQIELNQWRI